ncbi:MAG: HEAT repeat domain-containing protein [Actinomycetota bacterium]|nr:HEAT repeat domain-containing protein [Actinomycetota bacterium]
MAGHLDDALTARSARLDPSPPVRVAALGALDRLGLLATAELSDALEDRSPLVRRRACELCATRAETGAHWLPAMLGDDDATVVEAASFALGELGCSPSGSEAVPALAGVVTTHEDPLCREAAVAALGAIGDASALPAILAATTDKAAVRRRAVLALAPFDGPEVDAALARAGSDRDWQVRQAAEDLGVVPDSR